MLRSDRFQTEESCNLEFCAALDVRPTTTSYLVLLMLGRDDFLLLAYLNSFSVLSDIDMSTWKNGASLRVRYSSITTCPRGSRFSGMPSLTFADA